MNFEEVLLIYKNTKSLRATALKLDISTATVRKILISENAFSSPRSIEIKEISETGLSTKEISEELEISKSTVNNYIPYMKGRYSKKSQQKTQI